jgi:hypothetical protein
VLSSGGKLNGESPVFAPSIIFGCVFIINRGSRIIFASTTS